MLESKANNPPSVPLDAAAAARVLSGLGAPDEPMDLNDWDTRATHAAPSGYIIDRVIGAGGGGTVYRAFREGSDRPVALKVLEYRVFFPGSADPRTHRAAERARRELQLLQDLHLTILPRVIDHGIDAATGRLYIATEFIEGHTLDEYCEELGLRQVPGEHRESLRQLVEILARVSEAVQALHPHGIIHRDLKPSNILMDGHGDPILIDLGIASVIEGYGDGSRSTLTEEGCPIGTPAFMAPEQARGERARISTRSDVYGLGAIAYKLLTGSTPHDTSATIHEAIRRVAQDQQRDPRVLAPTLPKSLAAVLSKACAQDPQGRYSSAAALAEDFRRWIRGDPVEAQPPGLWARCTRFVGRHPFLIMAGISTFILVGSLLLTSLSVWWYNQQPWQVRRIGVEEVRVIARSGSVLQSWSTGSEPRIRLAEMIDRPAGMGGGRIAITVMSRDDEHQDLSDQLVVWSVDDLQTPVWRTSNTLSPPTSPQPGDSTYTVGAALIADVFRESPGDELVVAHNQVFAPSALRVYNMKGDVLYSTWHIGAIGQLYWMRDAELLVLQVNDNTSRWGDRGFGQLRFPIPTAVVGLHLDYGARLGFLNGSESDTHARIAWYRYRLPAEAEDALDMKLVSPVSVANRGSTVQVNQELRPEALARNGLIKSGAIWWEVNASGQIMYTGMTDSFVEALMGVNPRLDPQQLTLGELPPVNRQPRP